MSAQLLDVKIGDIIGSARLVRGDGDGTVSSVTYGSGAECAAGASSSPYGARGATVTPTSATPSCGAAAVAFEKGAVDLADIMSSAAGVTWIEELRTRVKPSRPFRVFFTGGRLTR
ncbi:MAG: hypothetical protein M0C28_17180 [Candidatus Moduliflexus flocculans]|nr:hypothetical protein [Candidatus Moduliflexus flocculans]